jgi:hypothetical protein
MEKARVPVRFIPADLVIVMDAVLSPCFPNG